MLQFVVEALVVSLLGGTIGLFLGAGFAAAMSIQGRSTCSLPLLDRDLLAYS
jgi:ABC-type antimicrobial peptide transport system permease subunit